MVTGKAALVLLVAGSSYAMALAAHGADESALCADSFERALVRDYYERRGPGDPPPVPGRAIDLIETKIVSALPGEQAIGSPANPERIGELLATLDRWGQERTVGLVVTVDGWHAYNFPIRVPKAVREQDGTYRLVNEGRALAARIDPAAVSYVYALDLPKGDGSSLRALSIYGPQGDLILGLYATEPGKPQSPQVIEGFSATWAALERMPRACSSSHESAVTQMRSGGGAR